MARKTTRRAAKAAGRLQDQVLSHPPIRRWRHARPVRTSRWARSSVQAARTKFIVGHWRRFAPIAAGSAGLTAAALHWLPGGPTVRGFSAGAFAASVAFSLWYVVVSSTGTVAKQMGVDAEEWTATELRRLRRRGWDPLHGFLIDKGDVDHLLVGHGRILALETKWSADPWELVRPEERVVAAAAQVRHGADRVQMFLKSVGITARVDGVVVLWGAVTDGSQREPTYERSGTRVAVVHGSALRTFLKNLRSDDSADIAGAWDALAGQVERNAAHDARKHPAVPKVTTQLAILVIGAAIGLLFVIALTELAVVVFGATSVLADLAVLSGLVFAGAGALVAERRRFNRPLVVGVTIALLSFVALVALRIATSS